jgi:hypothetical protein
VIHPRIRAEVVKVACFAAGGLLLVAVAACSSLFHFSSPSAQAVSCAVGADVLPELEADAAICGPLAPMCESLLVTVFGYGCSGAVVSGANQAEATAAGLKAARAAKISLLPSAIDLAGTAPAIFDQGDTGSCWAHATARAAANALTLKALPLGYVPSPDCLYRLGRCMMRSAGETSGPLTDTGTDPFYGMMGLSQFGVTVMGPSVDGRNSDCSTTSIGKEPILSELEREARALLVGAWQITSTGTQRLADISAALAANLPVTIGVNADQALEDWSPDKPPLGAPDPANLLGGHMLCVEGITVAGDFVVANSWGTEWGDSGRFLASPAWVLDPGVGDLYVFGVLPGSY